MVAILLLLVFPIRFLLVIVIVIVLVIVIGLLILLFGCCRVTSRQLSCGPRYEAALALDRSGGVVAKGSRLHGVQVTQGATRDPIHQGEPERSLPLPHPWIQIQ